VQLGPADAAAQLRLGEVLEKREDLDGARAAYERALEIDDRQWKVYFTLARLCLRRGEETRAAQLYRAVMRRAPDEELVIDAARRAIDLEEYLGTLGDLERELSPLAYAHADKPVYRNLLLELYDRYGTPLVARARAGDASVAHDLERLGEHGLRPLLDVLVDGDAAQQRVAVALLGAVGNSSAAPALFKLALTHRAPDGSGRREDRGARVELREQAALAAAEVATARDLPSLLKLMAEPEKQLRVAAAYGLGRLFDDRGRKSAKRRAEEVASHGEVKRAQAALLAALDDGAVDVQVMSCLALGQHGGARAIAAMAARLRASPTSEARKPVARVGCAFGLGMAALRKEPLSTAERPKAQPTRAARSSAWQRWRRRPPTAT
jgi:tetratricopeptide (TPR) repeat protein